MVAKKKILRAAISKKGYDDSVLEHERIHHLVSEKKCNVKQLLATASFLSKKSPFY